MFIRNPISDDLFTASNRPNRVRMLFFIRSYTNIIAILISFILFVSLVKGYINYFFIVVPIYWIYIIVKSSSQKHSGENKYYRTKGFQFIRALGLIVGTTIFLSFLYSDHLYYQTLGSNDNLWLLYLLAVYVISQRGSTNLFGLILLAAVVGLYIVEPKNNPILFSIYGANFTVSLVSKAANLVLFSTIFYIFVRHMADTIADLNLILNIQDKLREMESEMINSNTDFNRNTYLERVVEMISKDFKYDHVNIFRVTSNNNHALCVAAACEKGKELTFQHFHLDLINQQSIIRRVVETHKSHVANDVDKDDYYFRHENAFPNTKAELTVPINTMSGLYGVLDVQVHLSNYFLSQDLSAIEILANHIGWIIDNTRQIKQIDSVNRVVRNIAGPIFTQNDLEETLREVADVAYRELKADLVVLYSYDPREEQFVGPIYSGIANYPDILLMSQSDADSIIHRIFSSDEKIYLFEDLMALDLKSHPLFEPSTQHQLSGKLSFIEREGIRANVIIPLMDDKEFVGVLFLNYRNSQNYSQWDKQRYFTFAHLAALAIQKMQFHNRMIQFEMKDLADRVHDALIGDTLGLLKTLESINTPHHGIEWKKIQERIEIAKSMTDRLYNDVRYVQNVLDLETSDNLWLDLDRLATLYRQVYCVEIRQNWHGNIEEIPIKWVYTIRYILRQAIANSTHHGKAKNIDIIGEIRDNVFYLVVSDDGRGFIPEKQLRISGLKNMRTRVEKLGGEFIIESQHHKGTTIKISVPIISEF